MVVLTILREHAVHAEEALPACCCMTDIALTCLSGLYRSPAVRMEMKTYFMGFLSR